MAEYPSWEGLERLLETDPAALSYLIQIQPDLINRWIVLRAKMGRHCPMARGALKAICGMNKDNKRLINSINNGKLVNE